MLQCSEDTDHFDGQIVANEATYRAAPLVVRTECRHNVIIAQNTVVSVSASRKEKQLHELWLCRTLVPVSPFYNLLLLERRVRMSGTNRVHGMLMKSCVHLWYVRTRRLVRISSKRAARLVHPFIGLDIAWVSDARNAYRRCVLVSLYVIYDTMKFKIGRKSLLPGAATVHSNRMGIADDST